MVSKMYAQACLMGPLSLVWSLMAKIYTRTGDGGKTRLANGQNARKASARFDVIGGVDELNAHLGLVVTHLSDDAQMQILFFSIQNDLFALGAILAGAAPEKSHINAARVSELEASIDQLGEQVPPLRAFILPGGCPAAAQLHVARTVCRRAERVAWALEDTEPGSVPGDCLRYLNRLSDLLFMAARTLNQPDGETEWQAPDKR